MEGVKIEKGKSVVDAEASESRKMGVDGDQYKEFALVHDFDWDNLGKFWKEDGDAMKGMTVNPITAIFEKIGSMTNCTISVCYRVNESPTVVTIV